MNKDQVLAIQEGGNHYKQFPIQPIELIIETQLSFVQGNIVKYITRYPFKNGLGDLRKVVHYAGFGLAYALKDQVIDPDARIRIFNFIREAKQADLLNQKQAAIIWFAVGGEWRKVITATEQLIAQMEAEED
jgi:hypothetical protein